MYDGPPSNEGPGCGGLAAFAFVAVAIGCCGGPALIANAAGGVPAGTLMYAGGIFAGAILLGIVIVLAIRTRSRERNSEPDATATHQPTPTANRAMTRRPNQRP